MKNLLIIAVIIATGVSSCKKVSSDKNNTPPNYQPDATGSQWAYQVMENFNWQNSLLLSSTGGTVDGVPLPVIDTTYSYGITATGIDTTVNGLVYAALQPSPSSNSIYISNQDSLYFGIGFLPVFALSAGVQAGVSDQPIIYLKNEPVGTSWTQSFIEAAVPPATTPDTTIYTITIMATGTSKVVNGTTYTGVLEEEIDILPGGLSALTGGVTIPTGFNLSIDGDYYFANGVGLIEVDINSSLWGFQYTQTLTSATIK